MHKPDLKKHFQLLELDLDCSYEDLLNSYTQLKKLYSADSLALIPLEDEFDTPAREQILHELDRSFQTLSKLFKEDKKPITSIISNSEDNMIIESPAFSGSYFKAVRRNQNLELQHISFVTKISRTTLENIEEENFHKLPHPTYLKCLVKTYAEHLNLDPNTAAHEYMKKFQNWERKIKFTY